MKKIKSYGTATHNCINIFMVEMKKRQNSRPSFTSTLNKLLSFTFDLDKDEWMGLLPSLVRKQKRQPARQAGSAESGLTSSESCKSICTSVAGTLRSNSECSRLRNCFV